MKCSCCHKDKTGEYLHVLAVEPNKFNYCCTDCLAAHIGHHLKLQFKLSDEDKKEMKEIADEQISSIFKTWNHIMESNNKFTKKLLDSMDS